MIEIIKTITKVMPPGELFHWGIDAVLLYLLWRKDGTVASLVRELSRQSELLQILVYGRKLAGRDVET